MTGSISSLDNMSMQLYGTPYMPAYQSQNVANPYAMNYAYPQYQSYANQGMVGNSIYGNGYATPATGYSAYTQPATQQPSAQQTTATTGTNFQGGLTQAETKALVKTYQKGLEPVEKLAIGGMASTVIMQNPRVVVHPWNTLQTFFGFKNGGTTNKMFEGLRDSNLWKDHAYVMEEAFAQMNRTEARSMTKLGLFRSQYSAEDYKKLADTMETALKSGNVDEIAKATETLRHAQVNDGKIAGLWNKIRGKDAATVSSRMADSATIAKNTSDLLKCKDMTFGQAWNRAGGTMALLFGGFELIGSAGKIKTAFQEDSTTGFKQLGQSVVKAAANTVGWQAGEALGIWGATKITPAITKALGPKWGTIVGALARPVCAVVTACISRKLAKAVVGEDVVNKIQAEQTVSTPEGQVAMVQDVIKRAQQGEQIDPLAMQAAQKIAMQYGAVA